MAHVHEKIVACISHLTDIAQFRNHESSMKNTQKGLEFMYKHNGFDINYIKILVGFYNYIKNFKMYIAEHIEMYNLAKYIYLLKHQPSKFPLGSIVQYNKSTNSCCMSNINNTVNGIVDDYDYVLNQYQIKCDNDVIGWIPEKYLTNET